MIAYIWWLRVLPRSSRRATSWNPCCCSNTCRGAKIADIGSGAGLPIIPCLIARPDLEATLIESSQKKSVFLREALNQLGRPSVILRQPFEDVPTPDVSFVTCRALDQFMNKISTLINWAPAGSTLLLYGGETLREQLKKTKAKLRRLSNSTLREEIPLRDVHKLHRLTENHALRIGEFLIAAVITTLVELVSPPPQDPYCGFSHGYFASRKKSLAR